MKAVNEAEMEAQLATAAMHFLRRSTIQGEEVQHYVAVHNWLQHKVDKVSGVLNPVEPLVTRTENDKE